MLDEWVEEGIALPLEEEVDVLDKIREEEIILAFGADWWGSLRLAGEVPDQKGKWKAAPLPVFNEKNPPTTVHGGTGFAMLKSTENKDLAWEFMKLTQLNEDNAVKRYEITGLYPPLLSASDREELNQPSEYFSGQVIGELYGELASEAPTQNP